MGKLAICDFVCQGGSHETFNAAIIYALSQIYNNWDICLFAHESLIQNLQVYWKNKNILLRNVTFESIPVQNTGSEKKRTDIFDVIVNRIENFFEKNDKICVYVTAFLPLHYFRLLTRNWFICYTFHGGLETLLTPVRSGFSFSVLRYCISHPVKAVSSFIEAMWEKKLLHKYNYKRIFDCNNLSHFSFIVLSKGILSNLDSILRLPSNLYCIEHPVIYSNSFTRRYNGFPVFAIFGYGANNNLFVDLARLLKSCESPYELRNIGMRTYLDDSKNPNVNQINRGFLSREEMEMYAEDVDFFLNFYTSDMYRLTCSGSIVEAISYEKPVIYISNDCYNSFNEGYSFGIECNDVVAMSEIISTIIDNWSIYKETEYKTLVENVKRKKTDMEIKKMLRAIAVATHQFQ